MSQHSDASQKIFLYLSMLGALLVMGLGLSVLLGWYTRNVVLIQVSPSFVPMQYNTALGFIFIGLGLALKITFPDRKWGLVAGLASVVGALTLIEYSFAIDLGIDQLFMKHYITVETSHPGRMAPNTALCFFLSGMAIICSYANFQTKDVTALLITLIVFSLGFFAFIGYFLDIVSAYSWGSLTQMAVHTAAGFLAWGIFFSVYLWYLLSIQQETFHRPIVIFFIGAMLSLLFWQLLNHENRKNVSNNIAVGKMILKHELEDRLEDRAENFKHILGMKSSEQHAHHPIEIHGMVAIDEIPFDGNEVYRKAYSSIGMRYKAYQGMHFVKKYRDKILEERKIHAHFCPVRRLLFFVGPIIKENEVTGFLVASQTISDIVTRSFDNSKGLYNAEILSTEGKVIFDDLEIDYRNKNLDRFKEWSQEIEVSFDDARWILKVWPTEKLFALGYSWSPIIVLTVGLMLSALLSLLMYLFGELSTAYKKLKESTNALIQTEKMSTIGTFVAGISHELNNPIAGILAYTEVLLSDDKIEKEKKSILEGIKAESKRCSDIVKSLLSFSHVQKSIKFQKTNIKQLIEVSCKVLNHRIKPENIIIKEDIEEGLSAEVLPQKIQQIVLNLLTNAMDAILESENKTIVIKGRSKGKNIALSISDHGKGIPEEDLRKIYDAFFTTKEPGKGTGLGLSIVKNIIEEHHGEILVETELGKGSTFTVVLPQKQKNN